MTIVNILREQKLISGACYCMSTVLILRGKENACEDDQTCGSQTWSGAKGDSKNLMAVIASRAAVD